MSLNPASSRSAMRLHERSRECNVSHDRTLVGTFFMAMFERRRTRRAVQAWTKSRGISNMGFRDRLSLRMFSVCEYRMIGIVFRLRPVRLTSAKSSKVSSSS